MNNEFFRNKVMGLVKWVLPFYLLTFLPLSVSAQKFALVDMEYILKNIPAYERANEQLSQVSKQWQAEVDALTTEAQTLYKKIRPRTRSTMPSRTSPKPVAISSYSTVPVIPASSSAPRRSTSPMKSSEN